MVQNAESTIQGLNIIPTDNTTLTDELSPMSDDINRDLEAQLAMWTNFQFPNSSTLPLTLPPNGNGKAHPDAHPDNNAIDEDERIFSLERDTASRSRHKTLPVEDFTSGHFFGNVGASLAHHHHPTGSHTAAAHERAKFQQLQQHLRNHDNNNAGAGANGNGNTSAGNDMGNPHQMNELFGFYPNDDMNLNPAIVDPFLNPSDVAAGVVGGGGYLPPLTIRPPTHGRPHPQHSPHSAFSGHNTPQLQMHQLQQQQQQQQMQTIDPATTTLGHHHPRVTLPPPSKRQQKKGSGGSVSSSRNGIIPVDHDYTTAPPSAIGDDDMDHEYRLHNSNRQDHDDHDGMDGLEDLNPPLPPQLDASGNPIPYSAAEDKRRRNTLASARFRQKKKEREAAMERKARELDERVSGLERECESLRKENRMLRGLLVDGVPTTTTSSSSSNSNPNSSSNSNSNAGSSSNGGASEETSDGKNVIGAGASVVLLEELVRLLKANSAVLNNNGGGGGGGHGNASGHAAPTPNNGRATTSGKRKRGGGN